MKLPVGEECTPDISDRENENFAQFNKCANFLLFHERTKTESTGRQTGSIL